MLGIPYFLEEDGEKAVVENNKQLNAAIRKFRKQRRTDPDDSFTKVLHGRKASEPTDPAYVTARQWIAQIRAEFTGFVIRRTGDSLDYKGRPISAMKKYEEHVMLVDLYEPEYENLERIAEELCEQKDAGMVFGLGRVSAFLDYDLGVLDSRPTPTTNSHVTVSCLHSGGSPRLPSGAVRHLPRFPFFL